MTKKNLSSNKGVTLIALVTTIIVLMFIIGITWVYSGKMANNSQNKAQMDELKIVQGAILQVKTKYDLTGKSLPGSQYTSIDDIKQITDEIERKSEEEINLKDTNPQNYYLLTVSDLDKMGVRNVEDEYVVNYITGEVINITKKVTKDKQALYIYIIK